MNTPIWNEMSLSPYWELWCAGCIHWKNWLIHRGINVLHPEDSNMFVFFVEMHASSNQWNRLIGNKSGLSLPGKL
jgi:hypothetical protein